MIDALVLTAGVGRRLDPLTRLVAKPAMPLDGDTLIEHIVAWLTRRCGVRQLVLNLHHRPASITARVADGQHLGARVRYSWERQLLGSAGGPRRALPLLETDPFLIVNGDTLCDVDVAGLVAQHVQTGAEVTMAVIPNPSPDHYGGVMLDRDDAVVGFPTRGRAQGSSHFVGVQAVNRSVFEGLDEGVPAETVAGLYRQMLRDRPGSLRGYRMDTAFLDVGTPRDYLDAVLRVRGDAAPIAAPTIDPSARLTRTVVWPDARVGADVQLDSCIVAGAVVLPAGFSAQSSVLVPASLVTDGDIVEIRGDVALFAIGT
ncbi:MAG: NDP-sugar synthase [Vicinamibacterales bacterium]